MGAWRDPAYAGRVKGDRARMGATRSRKRALQRQKTAKLTRASYDYLHMTPSPTPGSSLRASAGLPRITLATMPAAFLWAAAWAWGHAWLVTAAWAGSAAMPPLALLLSRRTGARMGPGGAAVFLFLSWAVNVVMALVFARLV